MRILNKKISGKTISIINTLTTKFKKPVHYLPLSPKIGGFGAADYFSDPRNYLIYLSTTLDGEAFETNILHELFHIVQIESGFPVTGTQNNFITASDPAFFDDLGRRIQVTILDLDVNSNLVLNGYSSDYFINSRFESLKSILGAHYNFTDKYNLAHFIVQFILFLQLASKEQINYICPLLDAKYNNITHKAKEISNDISSIGFNTPLTVAKCFCYLFTSLDLWDIQLFIYNNTPFKTRVSFEEFINKI